MLYSSLIFPFRAKYQPYDMLRQQFWAQYLKQYDTDETNTISHIELTSMLDSLGSTLSRSTIDSFFTRHGKTPSTGELTIEETVSSLEEEVSRPVSQKKRLSQTEEAITDNNTGYATPMYDPNKSHQDLAKLRFNGPAVGGLSGSPKEMERKLGAGSGGDRNQGLDTQPDQPSANTHVIGQVPYPLGSAPEQVENLLTRVHTAQRNEGSSTSGSEEDLTGSSGDRDEGVERVINIKTCPLCHQPRLKRKGEVDIVTHLAICASGDWARVDRIIVDNFVTASQAHRKWYTVVMNKVTTGAYSLGAVSGRRTHTWFLVYTNDLSRTQQTSSYKTV
jgi:phosphatidylserine decarboxylase